jgi:hypothetical protein
MERRHGRARPSRRWVAGLALVAAGSVLALVGTPAGAAPEKVNGQFQLQSTSGPDCSSPVGVCMTGTVSGRIKGSFSFTVTSVLTTADTPTTGALVTTGDAVVETRDGRIDCKLTGTLVLDEEGPFVSLCMVTGGTRAWTGADGYLRTTGTFTFGAGGSGSYDGKVTAP